MKTINLQEKMLKENHELQRQQEEFLKTIQDQLDIDSAEEREILEMVFSEKTQKAEKHKTNHYTYNELVAKHGNKLFHISQIERIAQKYALRFLPADQYIGIIDPLLGSKIKTYIKENELEFNGNKKPKFKIMAPVSSFKLLDKKDPLFFIEAVEDYYVLIHKWGEDLSYSNRIKGFILNILPLLVVAFVPAVIYFLVSNMSQKSLDNGSGIVAIVFGIAGTIALSIFTYCQSPNSKWDEGYKD